jgi:molecular chaperone HtpG
METFAFQAEINQLMSLIIHAFYSNKEIFLRELVANASDAMDKYRHYALTHDGDDVGSLRMRIRTDKENRVLVIEDNGIGMTRQELIDNLGTIARSGTKQFIQSLAETKDMSLIGQFGVGFYSAYLVADKVTVYSRVAGAESETPVYVWESDASGTFTIRECAAVDAPFLLDGHHGTQLVLHLKDDDFLSVEKLKEILLKHSGYIGYPIEIEVEREVPVETTNEDEAETEGTVTEAEKETESKTVKTLEWEVVNKQKPIWMRKPDEVTSEDYQTFYKSISNDWDDALTHKHFSVEGQLEFRGLLYVPKHPPFDMFGRNKRDHLKLYVRRVFITDNCEDFVPEWLSFIRGVVDSDDLPLNVSREMLQQNKIMKVIQKNIVKKSVEMMTELMEDKERYATLYEHFGKNIKLGIYDEDEGVRAKLVELLQFYTSKSGDERIPLRDYVTRMKEGQKHIYYIAGESIHSVANAPFTESLRKKGIEVLYLVDTMDEYLTQRVQEYDGKRLINVAKETTEADEVEEDATDANTDVETTFKPLCEKMASVLGDKVEKVVVSKRLTRTPAVIVSGSYGWTANMERIMKAQALQNNQMAKYMSSKKIMEINPGHRMVRALLDKLDEKSTSDMIQLIYEASMISSGFGLPDPGFFVGRVYRMIELGLDLMDEEDATETTDGHAQGEAEMEQVD